MDAVLSTMVNEAIGPGSESRKVAAEAARRLGLEKGCAIRDRHRALDLALAGLGLEKGAKVIISALSPAYYVDVLESSGCQALYADVDQDSGTVAMESISALMNQQPAALILHNPYGSLVALEIFDSVEIPYILDVSHVLSTGTYLDVLNTTGSYVFFDMEWNSMVTAGGGAVLLPVNRKHRKIIKPVIDDLPEDLLLPDLNASLALVQLENLDKHLEQQFEIEDIFRTSLMKSRHKSFVQKGEWNRVPFAFPVLLQSSMNDVIQYTHKKGIMIQPAFADVALSRHPKDEFPCPQARNIMLRTVLFPLFSSIGKKNIEMISKLLATLP